MDVDIGNRTSIDALCPVCGSEVRYFFINLNEKILMCENPECDYPFGHENIEYLKEDNHELFEMSSTRSRMMSSISSSVTGSIISAAAYSEIDHINRACDDDESQCSVKSEKSISRIPNRKKNFSVQKDCNKKIYEEVEVIKRLNKELIDESVADNVFMEPKIKNKKWIHNLMALQECSNIPLVKPEELRLVDNDNNANMSGLKIDIDATNEDFIKIDIGTKSEDCKPIFNE